MAWGSPTIQRIVVGIRTNLTQQVSKGPREGGPFNNAGGSDLVRIIYFFYVKIDLNSITKLVLITMGTNTSKIYVKEEFQQDANIGSEEDQTVLVPPEAEKKDHKFLSKSNPRRAGFVTHFYVL